MQYYTGMQRNLDILLSLVRKSSRLSDRLITENREEIIDHLCRDYEPELAERVEAMNKDSLKNMSNETQNFIG